MFEDSKKKNYSEMSETELNIDENYLNIFEDELNSLFGEKKINSQNNFISNENITVDKIIKDNKQSQIFIPNAKLKNEKNIYQKEKKNIIGSKEEINKNEYKLNDMGKKKSKVVSSNKNFQKKYIKKPIFKNDKDILKSNIDVAKKFFKEIENDKTEELKKELSYKTNNSNVFKNKKFNNINDNKYFDKKKNDKKKNDNKDIELDEKDILAIKMLIKYLNK